VACKTKPVVCDGEFLTELGRKLSHNGLKKFKKNSKTISSLETNWTANIKCSKVQIKVIFQSQMDIFIPNKIKTTILKIKHMSIFLFNKYNNLLQPKYRVQKVKVSPWVSYQRLRVSVLFSPLHVFLLRVIY